MRPCSVAPAVWRGGSAGREPRGRAGPGAGRDAAQRRRRAHRGAAAARGAGHAVRHTAGIGLFAAADHVGLITLPPAWRLAAAMLATLAPSRGSRPYRRVGARRPAAEILQAETA